MVKRLIKNMRSFDKLVALSTLNMMLNINSKHVKQRLNVLFIVYSEEKVKRGMKSSWRPASTMVTFLHFLSLSLSISPFLQKNTYYVDEKGR